MCGHVLRHVVAQGIWLMTAGLHEVHQPAAPLSLSLSLYPLPFSLSLSCFFTPPPFFLHFQLQAVTSAPFPPDPISCFILMLSNYLYLTLPLQTAWLTSFLSAFSNNQSEGWARIS